ncbi:Rib/alpha-like domain-containing protein, partial [Levyella massiliensis]|uniref:Rib/alpha-like domain-containing protein n=1 Tax=Levyella massiliensis TaxID=938289 RepID=UPI00399B3B72
YTAEGGTVNKPYGEKATEAEITDVVTTNAPNERVKSKKIIGDIPTTGVDQKVAVEITYADGSTATVQVLVSYGKAKDAFDPTGQNLSVKQNASEPSPADAITNKDALPANTGYSWTTPVDTSEVGTHEYTVKVTYPDGSEDFVKVNVTVEATAPAQTDAEKYKADGGKVNKPYGQTATAEDVVNAVTTDAPKDKVKSIKAVDAIPTKGKNQPVKVEVTYADGTKDTVTVTVNYMDAADAFNPETKPITVDKGQAPDAKDGIANKEEFPEGTTITWKKPVDTNKPGEKEGTVVVTYPDGSTDEVKVKVVVQDKKTQADENEPKVKDEIIKEGQKPDLTDNVTNLDKLPKGTKVKDITPDGAINPNKPGEYEGTLEIEYPDGSKDVVKVKVTVEKAKTQADENEPKVKDEIIKE